MKNLFLVISLVLLVSTVYSASMQAPSIGARATGMGGAFVAIADDPSSIYWNPAGLTMCEGTKFMIGSAFVDPHAYYETERGGEEENIATIQPVPNIFLTHNFNDSISMGLGYYMPFGLRQTWEDDSFLKYNSTSSEIWLSNLQLAASYKLMENFGIGASIGQSFANLNTKSYVWSVPDGRVFPSEGYVKTWGEGEGFSGNIGLLWSVSNNWTVGGAWRSETRINFEGESDFNPSDPINYDKFETDISTDFIFPQTVSLGISYSGFEKWLLSGQVDWVDWSKVDILTQEFNDPVTLFIPGMGLVAVDNLEITRDWKDTYIFRLGAEYKVNPKFTLRGGYMWDPSPVPKETLDPMMFDVSSNRFFVGASFPIWKINVDVAYAYSQGIRREAEDSENLPTTNGDYWGHSHMFELSTTYTF